MSKLLPADSAYLAELAADIAAHGGFADRNPVEVVSEAHARRQAFIQEMLDQRTDRAKMAKIALCASVYAHAVCVGAAEDAVRHCEHIADADFRRRLYGNQ